MKPVIRPALNLPRGVVAVLCVLIPIAAWPQDAHAQSLAVSREITAFNAPAESPANRAVGREFTVLNGPLDDILPDHAVSREFTVSNGSAGPPADQAVSREFSAYVPPYTFPEAISALRRAAGLDPTATADMVRLNLVITGQSATIIDILDAARATDLAAHSHPDL